jgi:hypothetical protein
MSWFIGVLLNATVLGVVPTHGWLKGEIPFESKMECQEKIPMYSMHINKIIDKKTWGMGEIELMVCITEEEWITKNTEYGHQRPELLTIEEKPSKQDNI